MPFLGLYRYNCDYAPLILWFLDFMVAILYFAILYPLVFEFHGYTSSLCVPLVHQFMISAGAILFFSFTYYILDSLALPCLSPICKKHGDMHYFNL
jgi:hypothetical protein